MHFKMSSAICFNFDQSKMLSSSNGFRKHFFINIVMKGENAGNHTLLLFQQCFLSFPEQISDFQSH